MVPILKTTTTRASMVLTLHVCEVACHTFTEYAHTKRCSHSSHPSLTCLWEVLFRAVPRLSSRVWRRAVTTTGLVYFVPTRPTVAKELCPELYMTFREARKTLPPPQGG